MQGFSVAGYILGVFFIIIGSTSSSYSSKLEKSSVESYLERLELNPQDAMKEDPHGFFNSQSNRARTRVNPAQDFAFRQGCRQSLLNRGYKSGRSQWEVHDRAQDIVDQPEALVINLKQMELQKLNQGQVESLPWSDDYWAIAEGEISKRYLDSEWPSGSWKDLNDYFKLNPAKNLIKENKLQVLSPAEKYDLLMGDSRFTYAQSMWVEGARYYKENGEVEGWMGLCHGWAAASMVLPNPVKRVQIVDVTGKHTIPFYPSDIKGLGTALFAKGSFSTKFVGGRCDVKEPKKDSNGRVIDPECNDNNPGTWHQVVVNQMGKSKRSFVLDATFDYQVWNQPAISYQYEYFNPKTKKVARELKDAVIKISDYEKDLFKKYRSKKAEYVVGIHMDFTYAVENWPSDEENQPTADRKVKYIYDLELDSEMNIIGGEWYNTNHPDFLWVPAVGVKVYTPGDAYLKDKLWRSSSDTDAEVKKAALYNSAQSLPLRKVVERLFELSL